jgi:hypothetical protein
MSIVSILLNGSEGVGSISFTAPTSAFPSYRTASGVRIQIPALITFLPPTASKSPLLLEDLEVVFLASDDEGEKEIGVARCGQTLTTERRDLPIMVSLDLSLQALAVYERIRDGKEAKFRLAVSANIRFLFRYGNTHHQISSTTYPFRGDCRVQYSREAWTKTLRELKFRDCVLVEIPFASAPPDEWESVWKALLNARDSFDAGGSTAWKNTVTSVRLALERWQKIDKEDHGPGWKAPTVQEREMRTKEQRIDNIRWHLMQIAHESAHTGADKWTRDDALLMLSTLCALLSVRKP